MLEALQVRDHQVKKMWRCFILLLIRGCHGGADPGYVDWCLGKIKSVIDCNWWTLGKRKSNISSLQDLSEHWKWYCHSQAMNGEEEIWMKGGTGVLDLRAQHIILTLLSILLALLKNILICNAKINKQKDRILPITHWSNHISINTIIH